MSGPKGLSYAVRQAAEQRRRDTEAARARCRELRRLLAESAAEGRILRGESTRSSVPSAEADDGLALEQLQARSRQLADELARSQQRNIAIVRQHAAQEVARLWSNLATGEIVVPEPTAAVPQAPMETRTSSFQDRAERCLAALVGLTSVDERGRLTDKLAAASAAWDRGEKTTGERLLLTVQSGVDQQSALEAREAAVREGVDALLVDGADLVGDGVEQWRTDAAQARTAADLDRLRARAEELRTAQHLEDDRVYVIHQTRLALADLGYEVGADFEVAAVTGTATVVTRPDLPDHGLQLQFLPHRARVLSNVVAFGDTSPVRDAEVEELTCHDIDSLQDAWERQGIDGELVHHQAPGDVPVERTSRARSARRTSERSLEQDTGR